MESIIFLISAVQRISEVLLLLFQTLVFKRLVKFRKEGRISGYSLDYYKRRRLRQPQLLQNNRRSIKNQTETIHCFYNDPLIHLEASYYLLLCNSKMRQIIHPAAVKRTSQSQLFQSYIYFLKTIFKTKMFKTFSVLNKSFWPHISYLAF